MHSQQVHYPYNPLQPGPMYFLTTQKCAGVPLDRLVIAIIRSVSVTYYTGIYFQINYLSDQCFNIGKGDYFDAPPLFEHHAFD